MGRRAGTSAAQTRAELLDAAAAVFARRGYEGAAIGEISAEAGLSRSALYSHFGSKAELFVAVMRAHFDEQARRDRRSSDPSAVADWLADRGADLDRPSAVERTFVIEAVLAAKNDLQVRALLQQLVAEDDERTSRVVRLAQQAGVVTDAVAPEAIAQLSTIVGLGALVLDVLDVPVPEHEDWVDLVTWLVGRFAGPVVAARPTTNEETS